MWFWVTVAGFLLASPSVDKAHDAALSCRKWLEETRREVLAHRRSPSQAVAHRRHLLASRHGRPHPTGWRQEWESGSLEDKIDVAAVWIRERNSDLSDSTALGLARLVIRQGCRHQVDPRFVLSLVWQESTFEAGAVSPCGALGLGQLMPETAALYGVSNPFDAEDNLAGTCRLTRALLNRWGHSSTPLSLTAAAYNAGEGAVEEYGGVPPYAETQGYVSRVLAGYHDLGGRGE